MTTRMVPRPLTQDINGSGPLIVRLLANYIQPLVSNSYVDTCISTCMNEDQLNWELKDKIFTIMASQLCMQLARQ